MQNLIKFKQYGLLTILLILSACSANTLDSDIQQLTSGIENPQKKAQTFFYECQSGYSFTTNIEGQMAWIFLPGETLGLPRIPSASGNKYTNGLSTFWSKGEEASLVSGSKMHKNCINNRSKAIWAHAKLNGVDYRAVGNEPGWFLEISEDYKLVFTYQYGTHTLIFNTSKRQVDPVAKKTVYLAQENGQSISVTIQSAPCQDSMSGESYESSATIRLDDQSFKGCGKALH